MKNNTLCPIKCPNMNCTNREYKKCDYYRNELSQYCQKKRQYTKTKTNIECKYCPTTILKIKRPTDCIYKEEKL